MTYPDAWIDTVTRAIDDATIIGRRHSAIAADAAIRALVPLVVERCAKVADKQAGNWWGVVSEAYECGLVTATEIRALTKEFSDA